MLTIKNVFHLPNRATEGFVRSILALLKVSLSVPDHTTLSRRGKSKRRAWRKLHIGADPESGGIQAVALTENSVDDAKMVEPLLQQIEQPIDPFAGDGSYDKRKVYATLNRHAPRAKVLIPPRKNAHIWQHGNTHAERLKRDENLRAVRKLGRKAWKENCGYHMRSLAETTMFRFKTIFGDRLSARLLETQTTQAIICCAALNRMTHLGMPESYKVSPSGKVA